MSELDPERFAGASALVATTPTAPRPKRFVRQQVPDAILNDAQLKAAMRALPANYNFEIMKTVWRLREANAKHVALQFPEGLLMYACVISDILLAFAHVQDTLVMGDVTYGACCVDDFSAEAMGADFLVHYGHSCLVPVSHTKLPCMYIFVDIQIDFGHFIDSACLTFRVEQRILLAGTIQFASTVQAAKAELARRGFSRVIVPQARPLSSGEVLGCTAPTASEPVDAILFVADGRFHLEALMIANPSVPAYRYDPYGRVLTREEYDQRGMRAARRRAIERAQSARRWGLILGTLGRQGNQATMRKLQALVDSKGLHYSVVLLSEVTPTKLRMMPDVDAWVQVACPRLSIDWGEGFDKPTLTPYEAMVCLGAAPPWWEDGTSESGCEAYPMDYYARDGGDWNSSYHKPAPAKGHV